MNFVDTPAWKLLGILLALLFIVTMAWAVADAQREAEEGEDTK